MRIRLKPWQSLLLIAACVVLFTYGVQRFRYRAVRQQADLVRLLPRREGATFFVNVAALRSSHILGLIGTPKTADPDYQKFVAETGFDYVRDLDALAGSKTDGDSLFLLQGRFDWQRITRYAVTRGGHCEEYCSVPTSTSDKWFSFRRVQPDVIAVAASPNAAVVMELKKQQKDAFAWPDQPVWLRLPGSVLQNAGGWPTPLRVLATTLHAAHAITLSAGTSSTGELQLQMDAQFENDRIAEAVRNQLELETKMLKLELARENAKPSDADLTGLLVSGTFQLVNNDVVSSWPLRRELLETLQIQ